MTNDDDLSIDPMEGHAMSGPSSEPECDNYLPPMTCLNAPSSATGTCNRCKARRPSSEAQGLSEEDQHRLVMALARRRRRGRTGGPMSGGSFNYLCHSWDVADLIEKRSNLEPMADELLRYGGEDAAKETLALLFDLRAFEVRVEAHIERLRKVWKAVEWTTDCDWGADSIAEALAEYRGLSGTEDR